MEILKFGDNPTPNRSNNNQRKPAAMIVAGVLVAMMGMSTTLAGTITISGGRVEFGQGIVTTAACDGTIGLTPATTFNSAVGASDSFTVTELTLDSITVATAVGSGEGCLGKWFTIKAYEGKENAIPLTFTSGGSSAKGLQIQIPATGADVQGNWGTDKNPSGISIKTIANWSGGTNGTVTISNFVLSSDVTRFTIESSDNKPTLPVSS